MLELKNLQNEKQLDFNFFFHEPWDQRNSINRKQTVNIEKLIDFEENPKLEQFGHFQK